jgi:signal transduction histidine kinase
MKIRTKCIIAIAISTFLIFVGLHLVTALLLHPSYQAIENSEINQSLTQLDNVINYRLTSLESITKDYATWDDTYRFIQDKNQGYISNNLVDSTFNNLKINVLAFVNLNKSIVYCKSFDLNNSAQIETSNEMTNFVSSNNNLWNFSSVNSSSVSGLILMDDKPMLIATKPILTSNGVGPIMGGVLFGRYLDAIELRNLKQITNLDFSIQPVITLNQEDQIIKESLVSTKRSSLIKENNFDFVSGYKLVKDVNSNPVFLLKITESREIFKQADIIEYIFIASSAFLTIILAIILIFMMEKNIFKPMNKIASSVTYAPYELANIGSKQTMDELDVVENSVKDMVNKKMEAMNEVSTMVAHDLRNPLQGIKGASYVLKKSLKPQLNEKQIEMFQTIDNCLEYSNKIVSDLLDYSFKSENFKIKPTSIKSLINAALSTVQIPNNVKVVFEGNDDYTLSIDELKIQRVINNLIKNAIDAMPNGGTLTIAYRRIRNNLRIDITDTGTGMTKEVLEKIWIPFFTTKARGMGIGLAICKRIIEAHNGEISVESIAGKGTAFNIILSIT